MKSSQDPASSAVNVVDSFVSSYVASRDGTFGIGELVEAALSSGIPLPGSAGRPTKRGGYPKLERLLLRSVNDRNLAFGLHADALTPRAAYFRGAAFVVSPTEEELGEGTLTPGHRFEPFRAESIAPWEVDLVDSGGVRIGTRVAERPLDALMRYYQLLGLDELFAILVSDRGDNAGRIGRAGAKTPVVEYTVFDMRDVWKRLSMREGDALECTLTEWASARMSIRRLPAEELAGRQQSAGAWRERLEDGFMQAFEELGTLAPIREQIAYAYWFAGPEVLQAPPMHLGRLVNESKRISYQRLGAQYILWRSEQTVARHAAWSDRSPEPVGLDGSLDDILTDTGIALSSDEIEAYMRDQLHADEGGLEDVVKRMLAHRVTVFHDPEQEAAFHRFLFELWARVERRYDRESDLRVGVVRSRLLALLDEHLQWIRGLDRRAIRPEELPGAEMTAIADQVAGIDSILGALNEATDEALPGGGYAELVEGVNQVIHGLSELVSAVERKLPSGTPAGRPGTVRKARAPRKPAALAVLKVSLQRISPPIWRRIAVPDSFTLGDLHALIRDSMGWSDFHLHAFRIGQREFGPAHDVDGTMEWLDEAAYALSAVLPAVGTSFTYVYDFGDGWEHKVKVEKKLPAEGGPSPRCLAGKRACPPEDCGGVHGYYGFLDTTASPPEGRTAEGRETLEWIGDWDPERFDLEAANSRIAATFGTRARR